MNSRHHATYSIEKLFKSFDRNHYDCNHDVFVSYKSKITATAMAVIKKNDN